MLPALRKVLRIDGSGTPALDALSEAGKSVDSKQLDDRLAGVKSTDPATLIYTSGTTGRPKGCQLTHSNLLYEIRGAKDCFPTHAGQGRTDAGVSAARARAGPRDHRRGVHQQGHARVHQRHQEPRSDIRSLQADVGGVGTAGIREGVQHRRTERRKRRQGQDFRGRGRDGDRMEQGPGQRRRRARAQGQSTRCSTGSSTASFGLRSAATATPRSRAAPRWARASATSTAVSGCPSTRATGSPRPVRRSP